MLHDHIRCMDAAVMAAFRVRGQGERVNELIGELRHGGIVPIHCKR